MNDKNPGKKSSLLTSNLSNTVLTGLIFSLRSIVAVVRTTHKRSQVVLA